VGTHKVYGDRKVIREREREKNLEGLGLVAGNEYVDDRSASQSRRRSLLPNRLARLPMHPGKIFLLHPPSCL
jgi:hypothetical protein